MDENAAPKAISQKLGLAKASLQAGRKPSGFSPAVFVS